MGHAERQIVFMVKTKSPKISDCSKVWTIMEFAAFLDKLLEESESYFLKETCKIELS